MTERLPWWTLEVEHWLNKMRGVHPAVKGALLELDNWSWAHGEPACTVPDDDDELAVLSGLHGDWAAYGARVRKRLQKDAHTGRLFDPHLMGIYLRQSSRAQTNRTNGRRGAEARWGKTTPTPIGTILGTPPPPSGAMPNAIPNGKAFGIPTAMPNAMANGKATAMPIATQSPRVSSKILSLKVLETKDFRSDDGEFVASGMAIATPASDDADDPLDTAGLADDDERGDQPTLTEAERLAFGTEYYQRLSDRFETWATEHPDEAAALESGERKLFAWGDGALTPVKQKVLRDAMLERLRELKRWPTSDEWVTLQLQQRPPTKASG